MFFPRGTDSDMVSIKFWRGKFSLPAIGYECIAHALAFDRGVDNTQRYPTSERLLRDGALVPSELLVCALG